MKINRNYVNKTDSARTVILATLFILNSFFSLFAGSSNYYFNNKVPRMHSVNSDIPDILGSYDLNPNKYDNTHPEFEGININKITNTEVEILKGIIISITFPNEWPAKMLLLYIINKEVFMPIYLSNYLEIIKKEKIRIDNKEIFKKVVELYLFIRYFRIRENNKWAFDLLLKEHKIAKKSTGILKNLKGLKLYFPDLKDYDLYKYKEKDLPYEIYKTNDKYIAKLYYWSALHSSAKYMIDKIIFEYENEYFKIHYFKYGFFNSYFPELRKKVEDKKIKNKANRLNFFMLTRFAERIHDSEMNEEKYLYGK